MKIGPMELIVIFIVALLVIGPNKLPDYARKLGQAVREFTKATESLKSEIQEEVVKPMNEAQQPLKDAAKTVSDLGSQVRSSAQEVQSGFDSIGKDAPKTENKD